MEEELGGGTCCSPPPGPVLSLVQGEQLSQAGGGFSGGGKGSRLRPNAEFGYSLACDPRAEEWSIDWFIFCGF